MDVLDAAHVRRSTKLSVELVGPLVVATGELLRVAAALGYREIAVAADVAQGSESVVLATHDEYRLAEDLEGEVVPDIRHLLQPAHADPLPAKDLLGFEIQQFL